MTSNYKHKVDSTSLLIQNPKLLFMIFTVLGFLSGYLAKLQIRPIHNYIGDVISAKGALLEIITTLPFIFVYIIIVYVIINYFARIKTIHFNESELVFIGKFSRVITKNEVSEIRFVKNKKTNKVVRIILKGKSTGIHSLNFIKTSEIENFRKYFNLTNKKNTIIETQNEIKEVYMI